MGQVRSASFLVVAAALASIGGATPRHAHETDSVRGAPLMPPTIIDDDHHPDIPLQNALSLVSRNDALAYATGQGVHVAVLDGGFDLRHPMLEGHLGTDWDALDQDADAQDLGNSTDDNADSWTDSCVGHGTFVSGLLILCAPDAVIHPIRVLDDEGGGSPAALARGIDEAVEFGCDVINMSLVATTMTAQLEDSIDAALDAGVILVCAAGNNPAGPFAATYLLDRSITVGAVDQSLAVASFSPNQSLVDVFAPGVDLLGPLGGSDAEACARWSGTSFACAFVSAAAVLVKEDHPTMGFSAMLSRLTAATNSVSGASPASRGSIDLLEAVQD